MEFPPSRYRLSPFERTELRTALVWRRDGWRRVHGPQSDTQHDVPLAESDRLLAALDAVAAEWPGRRRRVTS